jgi:hypothetical protein
METENKRFWKLSDETILEGEVPQEMREPWGLMVIDHEGDWSSDFMDRFVENALKLGCRYFLVTGGNAGTWEEIINQIVESSAPEEDIAVNIMEEAEVDEACEHFVNNMKDLPKMVDMGIVFLDVGDTDEDDYLDQIESGLN